MYRSTEPACLAAKAAELQGADVAERVLRRLREATFVFGEPPDTPERIRTALRGVPALDLERLGVDSSSPRVRDAFRADWEEARAPNAYALSLEEDGEGSGRAKESEGHRLRYMGRAGRHRARGRLRTRRLSTAGRHHVRPRRRPLLALSRRGGDARHRTPLSEEDAGLVRRSGSDRWDRRRASRARGRGAPGHRREPGARAPPARSRPPPAERRRRRRHPAPRRHAGSRGRSPSVL